MNAVELRSTMVYGAYQRCARECGRYLNSIAMIREDHTRGHWALRRWQFMPWRSCAPAAIASVGTSHDRQPATAGAGRLDSRVC
jgi:hypothetical protein